MIRPAFSLRSVRRSVRSALLLGLLVPSLWSAGPAQGAIPTDPAILLPCVEEEAGLLERRLFADAADGRWNEHTLLRAALVASGAGDMRTVRRYEDRMAALAGALSRSGSVTGTPRQRAQAIFEFLHRESLGGGYQLDATDLRLALDQGRFNCVSASVLFNCLAEEFGLTARGLETPGHALSRLILPEGSLDVETTCPSWFQLLGDPEQQAEVVEQTLGFRPPHKASDLREVSAVELVATIYYNRGVDLLGQHRFAEAAAANSKALRLDPASATARGNLLATLNNWAIDLGARRHYADAVELLRQGMAADPRYSTFRTNLVHVHYQWVEDLCRQQRFREAVDVLKGGMQIAPGEVYFSRAESEVYRRWAQQSGGRPAAAP